MGARILADVLGREEASIRVVAPDVGGGFGPKLVFYPEEAAVAAAALITKRPVKWIEDRREHFIATAQERDQYWDVEIALDADGKILGVRGSLLHDHGAYTARGLTVPQGAVASLSLAYLVPAYRIEIKVALTNKVPVAPVRGAGQPQGVFVMERLLDRAARELKIDRAEIRRRNLVPPEAMPFKKGFVTRGGVPVVLRFWQLSRLPSRGAFARGLVRFFPSTDQSTPRRSLPWHRPRQLRRGHGPRAL